MSFFFNPTPTTEIYTLSLHDALPISRCAERFSDEPEKFLAAPGTAGMEQGPAHAEHDAARHSGDRKSTRLNSSHQIISYAVFCLKKKKRRQQPRPHTSAPNQDRGRRT